MSERKKYARDRLYEKPPKWQEEYARHFPMHTCPASRHARVVADEMLRDTKSPVRRMLIDAGYEPDHIAASIEETVLALWKARAAIATPPSTDGGPT